MKRRVCNLIAEKIFDYLKPRTESQKKKSTKKKDKKLQQLYNSCLDQNGETFA